MVNSLQGEVVPASEKEPECWSAADKFTVVHERDGFKATEISAYCQERGVFPEQVDRWQQTAQDSNSNASFVMTIEENQDREKRYQQDQKVIKQLKQDLRRKEKSWQRRKHY